MDANTRTIGVYNARLDWLDAAKAVAILFIFTGHWRTPDQHLELFSYMFHLQLFFTVSGMLYSKGSSDSFATFIKKRTFRLIIPYFFFAALNLAYMVLSNNPTDDMIYEQLTAISWGMAKGGLVAGELWFLPALWMVHIVYHLLRRLGLGAAAITAIGAALYMLPWYTHLPVLPWGVTSVPQFLIFFAAGDLFVTARSGSVQRFAMSRNVYSGILLAACTIGTLALFRYGTNYPLDSAKPLPYNRSVIALFVMLRSFVIIYVVFGIAPWLSRFSIVRDIGRNTLILFCTEEITKGIWLHTSSILSLPVRLLSAADILIFSVAMLLLSRALFFKVLNNHLPWAIGGKASAIPGVAATSAESYPRQVGHG